MKKIEAIIRPEKMDDVQEALAAAGALGLTLSQVHGFGAQHGFKEYYRGSEVIVRMRPKIKIELVVDDADCDRLAGVIMDAARTGEVGDGKIFILDVAEAIRVRTGETGEEALR